MRFKTLLTEIAMVLKSFRGAALSTLLALFLRLILIARRTVSFRLYDLKLVVLRGVFNPRASFSSYLLVLAALRQRPKGLRIAEIGCGSGLISIVLAHVGNYVVLTDISLRAVINSRVNSRINNVSERVDYVVCDLECFRPLAFDYAVTNPPYLPCPRSLSKELCCDVSCSFLLEAIRRCVRICRKRVLLTTSSLSSQIAKLEASSSRIVATCWTGLDNIYVIELSRPC